MRCSASYPAPAAPQACTVTSGTGTASANITNVADTCTTDTYSNGGTASGLVGSVVPQYNGGDNTAVSTDGTFTTKIGSGQGMPRTQLSIRYNFDGTANPASLVAGTIYV